MIFFKSRQLLKTTRQKLIELENLMDNASKFIRELHEGKDDVHMPEELRDTNLGAALVTMKQSNARLRKEESDRTWISNGITKFAEILRNKNSLELPNLGDEVISSLVQYVGANQGALFLVEDDETDHAHLKLLACYAYSKKKHFEKVIQFGEGLAGQCALEKEIIHLRETPANYIKITSGLGAALPRSILLCPLILNEKVFGIIEMASFSLFDQNKIDFVKKISESIASTIKNVKENQRRLQLLNATQQQAEELRAQEEEMRQNLEELQTTQEEMHRRSIEISRTSAQMRGLLDGINATMATIEFSPDGIVLSANENFLRTMKCSLKDIAGKHHRAFVPPELAETSDYRTFWSRLATGESRTGIFKRRAWDGSTVWLNAIYNPVRDSTGRVDKIVKFASDFTELQELQAQTADIFAAIDSSLSTIEFTPSGHVITANKTFLQLMEYTLEQIKGTHHSRFVSQDLSNTLEYLNFWQNLAEGKPTKGTFDRVTATGKILTLTAIYSPIRNAAGEVVKVIKFVTDFKTQDRALTDSNVSGRR